jgi:ABC-type multidrug transport system fused ATPase/permease subunit
MKLLLHAAFRNRKHFLLAIFTFFSLLFLTMANQTEMFSLGLMANTGADFFTLFENKKADSVRYVDLQKRWKVIDKKDKGYITKRDAAAFLAKSQHHNVLNKVLYTISSKLNIEQNLIKLITLLAIVALFKALFLFLSRYASQLLSIKITKDLRLQYFKHIQSLPLSFYQEHNIGALSARAVGDAGQIASALNSCLTNYLQMPFTVFVNLFACFYLSWKLSLIIFIGLPLIILPVIFLTRQVKNVSRQMQRNQETFTSVLIDYLAGIHIVKLFAIENYSLKKYENQNNHMAFLETKNAKYSLLIRPVLHTITTFCLVFVVIFGLYTLKMTVAQLLVFCGLLYLFYEPVKKIAEENANIQRGVVASERMFEVLNLKPNIIDTDGAKELISFKDKIEFKNVSFKYRDRWVLNDISFVVEKGQTVAIVGPTGSGKSTIVQLLPRLYDIQMGDILIDGISIKHYKLSSLRNKIGFVPQRPFLFYDTVNENITFGQNFSNEEVINASKKAHADEFIQNLPDKYETVLDEAGKTLSGGQQQRLAIARALVKNAPILIMDEATSSLDAISENKIKLALFGLHHQTTQIIIAHRLSTIEHADKIIFIDQGKKIAEGTKEQLMKSSEDFRRMWQNYINKQAEQVAG